MNNKKIITEARNFRRKKHAAKTALKFTQKARVNFKTRRPCSSGSLMLENNSFTEIVKPGDYVEEQIVDNFLGCVPPATLRSNLMQYGEPYSSAWDEQKQKYRSTWLTFALDGTGWKYCGTCFIGETTHRTSGLHIALD